MYIIPHFGWRQFTGTYSVSGSDADSLHSAGTLNAYLNLRGEAIIHLLIKDFCL